MGGTGGGTRPEVAQAWPSQCNPRRTGSHGRTPRPRAGSFLKLGGTVSWRAQGVSALITAMGAQHQMIGRLTPAARRSTHVETSTSPAPALSGEFGPSFPAPRSQIDAAGAGARYDGRVGSVLSSFPEPGLARMTFFRRRPLFSA